MRVRINKYLATCGLGSRRRVESYINQKKVSINGKLARLYDYVCPETDTVMVGKKIVKPKKFEYYILNKPKGVVSTTKDEFGRKTVLDFVKTKAKLKIAGRLDIDTTGVVLLTDDADLITKITQSKNNIVKTYRVVVAGRLDQDKIKLLEQGVNLGGYVTKPANVEVVEIGKNRSVFNLSLSEGKYHQIKKMCERIKLPFIELTRIAIGGLSLGSLMPGQVKKLKRSEIYKIFNLKNLS
ncbi:MAG: pseudouridine synthase [Patescibacteria group bacterium]|nr:MAG: pseudouridine synthase [Patescibacteria group bacterium]